ncbi:DNA polymerase III subunit tau [Stieleria bergensis]|uniref:DNA polymerase III subunit tau n=1 Tax=Stieleria bergensis TaxID=2528025 RepID=A0A517SPU0_9BACT|nr:DNA polymerase III subunit tau [Planctomycetes bacterium SV_7m_r]
MIAHWDDLIGNPQLKPRFSNAIGQQRLGGSLLFTGPPGIGKRSVATLLARTLLCERSQPKDMSPCGECPACAQVDAETHPDVIRVRKPDDKTLIPIDLLIGAPDVRMQEGFCRDIRLSPYAGKRKIAILEDADFLNEEGANCLLKTLEEPPNDALIILVGTSEQKQLPTIRSRCQAVRFQPLSNEQAIQLIIEKHQIEAGNTDVQQAVEMATGDIPVALRFLDAETREFAKTLGNTLSKPAPDPISLRRLINDRVEQAGKEPRVKRAALRDIFSICIQHYRRLVRHEASHYQSRPITLARLDRSVRAVRELDRMANVSTLIDCFAADIAAGTTGDRGDIGS